MRCSICGREASVFFSETVNGKTSQKFLCDVCARNQEMHSYNNFLAKRVIAQDLMCPFCKTKLSQFNKTGFLGCSNCYTAMASDVMSVLPQIQASTVHVPRGRKSLPQGKGSQANAKTQTTKEGKIQQLKEQLATAEKEKRYEDAKRIFEQLKAMGVQL